jgi:hypothetical protein
MSKTMGISMMNPRDGPFREAQFGAQESLIYLKLSPKISDILEQSDKRIFDL